MTNIQNSWRKGDSSPLFEYLKSNHPDSLLDSSGRTLLFLAVWDYSIYKHEDFPKNMFIDIVDALLDNGANPNSVDNNKNNIISALHFRKDKKASLKLLRKLLDIGATPSKCSILSFCIEAVQVLIEYGIDVSCVINYTHDNDIIKLFKVDKPSDDTNKLIDYLKTTGRDYCPATEKFNNNETDQEYEKYDRENKNIAKQIKVMKTLIIFGYHGGVYKKKAPVSAMDVLSNLSLFICKGLDLYRHICGVVFLKETDEEITLKIEVDNFST